jgi:hypothetical protein
MTRRWQWDTESAEWGVDLDEQAGVLRWWGADKPRAGVPAYAQGGGGADQPIAELLSTGVPSYACPPGILEDVMDAARAALVVPKVSKIPERPTSVRLPPFTPHTINRVAGVLQAAVQALTGSAEPLPVAQRQLSVEEIPDDRPTQSCATEWVTEVRLGDLVVLRCEEQYGGWTRGSADWTSNDFAGTGPLRMAFDSDGVKVEGAPAVVNVLATLLCSSATAP